MYEEMIVRLIPNKKIPIFFYHVTLITILKFASSSHFLIFFFAAILTKQIFGKYFTTLYTYHHKK